MSSITRTKPEAELLPIPAHLSRLPPHLGAEHLKRIKQAAYNLPQVAKPADFVDEHTPELEKYLDTKGFILLQPAASGARPSRWIAPELMDLALQHLDAVGNGRDVRTLMAQRTATLDAMGIQRNGNGWERLARQTMAMPQPAGWTLQAYFRVPIDPALVWAFFRNGDKAALVSGSGAQPKYAHADELEAHVSALIAKAQARAVKASAARAPVVPAPAEAQPQAESRTDEASADQAGGTSADRSETPLPKPIADPLESLLPRMQAECSTPQPIGALLAACTRAYERWEQRVSELDTLQDLTSQLAFTGYPESFPKARRLRRSVRLFVGPPNSGKTHGAFERLAKAEHGAYLAPLRLLALEGRDRLMGRGVACSLLTGEENVPAEGAAVVSSTIEMVGMTKEIEVAVIDEAQMIFDPYRGWAWTQAIVGVPAQEVIIICSAYAVPAIENLLGLCGESCEVTVFERKQHVQLLRAPVAVSELKKGDAVVAFSRRDVLAMRDRIAASRMAVSVIYGALPPEVRRREGERFAQGDSHVLVATDAIGMGLNLPIRRVLFSTMVKYDGQADRPLNESEVHQIAGRAGRFGMHEEGFVGVLQDAEPTAARMLKELLPKTPRAPKDWKAPVAPNWWHVDTIATRLGKTRLREVLGVFMQQLRLDDAHFQVAELEQMLELAEQLDQAASQLGLRERFIYAQAPVDTRTDSQVQEFLSWAASHARVGKAGRPWFLDEVDEHSRLDRMEQALRACTLWLWLDLRFPNVFGHLEAVIDMRGRLNDGIERQLKGKRPLSQVRGRMRRA